MNQPPSSSSGSSNKKHADFDRLSDRQNGGKGLSARLNWLRAAVLGANDGIVSTAGLVLGVAGATTSFSAMPRYASVFLHPYMYHNVPPIGA